MFLLNYSSLYPKANFILISMPFFYKNKYMWVLEVPQVPRSADPQFRNAEENERSPQNFGDQPLKIQIVQEFYLSGQTQYLVNSLKEKSSVSNCCELRRNIIFFLDSTFYILFIVLQFGCTPNNPFKNFVRRTFAKVYLILKKCFPHHGNKFR